MSEIVSGKGQKNAQSQLVTGLARFCMAALISAIFFLSDQIAHVRKLVLIVSPAASWEAVQNRREGPKLRRVVFPSTSANSSFLYAFFGRSGRSSAGFDDRFRLLRPDLENEDISQS